jgi:hypothetical protein
MNFSEGETYYGENDRAAGLPIGKTIQTDV